VYLLQNKRNRRIGTTRVSNLMIDVIAQTGRFPSSASSLANFNVEGERRYWVHVEIDRYTGKVLDEQVEEVVRPASRWGRERVKKG